MRGANWQGKMMTGAFVAVAIAGSTMAGVSPPSALAAPGDPFSIGNRIWKDDGRDGAGGFNAALRNNGLQDPGEVGLDGVLVQLYRDTNSNNTAEPAELIRTDITALGAPGSGRPGSDVAGYYLFDGLSAGTYFVIVPASEFAPGRPLAGWHSSTFNGTETVGATGATGLPATDLDDNGIEPATRRPDLSGVTSAPVVLTDVASGSPGLEPSGETDLSLQPDPGSPNNDPTSNDPTGWDGPGSIGRWANGTMADDQSNVAVDFGFIPPMSIGNRIWFDDSSDPIQWGPGGSRNNALIDATDDGNLTTAGIQNRGIANVDIQLYFDANANSGIDAGDTLISTTTTLPDGYYLFDGLAPGNYLVRIPSSEFNTGQPLDGLISSFDAVAQINPTSPADSNDNGINNAIPSSNGTVSQQIQLVYLSEATGELDVAATSPRGRFGETDSDSDLTIDFGFVRPPLSIGNNVWDDDHPTNQALRNNGLFDVGEAALESAEVALYRDLNNDRVVSAGEDTGLRDLTTSAGFYSFDNVPPGNYIVVITAGNFVAGGVLENTISSRNAAPNPIAADNQVDNNDNGTDAFVVGVGVVSAQISLLYGAEPTGETPTNSPVDGPNGRGNHGERDQDSDLSIDFGFFTPMSVGNRVWLDDSTIAANSATRNNAVLNPTVDDRDNPNIAGDQTLGVAGATVRLYRDFDSDGVIDAGEDTGRTVVTDANGYYVFDGLTRGNYVVSVEANNFAAGAPLAGFNSSNNATAPTDNNTDNTDDGIGTAINPTYGVISSSIALSYTSRTAGLEPAGGTEVDPTPQTQSTRGANGERDDFSNLTIDFGFTDLTAPILAVPAAQTLEATSSAGAPATFNPTATDRLDGARPVTCTPPSGSTFALGGPVTVACSAADLVGNTATGTFTVTVTDQTPPTLTQSANITNEATSAAGATITYTPPTATDLVNGPRPVTCTPPSGSAFAITATIVTCTSTDAALNSSSTTFTITIVDTTPPALTAPGNITAEATSANGATVNFITPTAIDSVDGNRPVTCSPGAGTIFPIAATAVTCTTADTRSNASAVTFTVTVEDTTPPAMAPPGNLTREATSPNGASVTFDEPTATDLVDVSVAVSCLPTSGTTLPIGESIVECTAEDASGNSRAVEFKVFVVDTVAPVIDTRGPLVAEADTSAGTAVAFDLPTAADAVGAGPVTCTPATGNIVPIGKTTVTCTTQDEAGNIGTTSFEITVVDTTAPVITQPSDLIVDPTGPEGAIVEFSVTAHDAVNGPVAAVCRPPSGTLFPIGNTTVTCTATDPVSPDAVRGLRTQAQPSSSATFIVTVRPYEAPPASTQPAPTTLVPTTASPATAPLMSPVGGTLPVTGSDTSLLLLFGLASTSIGIMLVRRRARSVIPGHEQQ